MKKEPPPIRQPTPEDDDDINRPPQDTSEEESGNGDSEFGDEPYAKRRKVSRSGDSGTMDRSPKRSRFEPSDARGTLANEPSNITASVFTFSQKNDDDEPGELFSQLSQPKKRNKTYTNKANGNIHADQPKPKNKKKLQKSPAKVKQDNMGFKTRDTADLMSRVSGDDPEENEAPKFKQPREVNLDTPQDTPEDTPRAKRASFRSTRNANSPRDNKQSTDAQVHGLSSSRGATPTKAKKNLPIFKQPEVPDIASPPPMVTKTFVPTFQPLKFSTTDDVGIGDLQDVLKAHKDTSFLPTKAPASSTTESSLLSTSYRAGSSSSLSSPPDSSDENDPSQLDTYERKATKIRKREPPPALCPICKVPVDRAFLEEFNSGNPLRARQQAQFCKAHKIRAAKEEWKDKDYPTIDWSRFDKRLQGYHSNIEDILAGRKASFYRNAFEDKISKGQMKSLRAAMLDNETMQGMLPGYYGSRGARVIIENITSKFASRIRRLATSDRTISTGGVPTYIQAVLAPELAVLLVMDDMKVEEDEARSIIRDSVEIGILLNEEQDEVIQVIESDDELAM